jgi:hypothetical protein
MPGEIMTEVTATVPGDSADDVPAAFAEPTPRSLSDGVFRTELLAGRDGGWKIQSLRRDPAALDAMRAGPNRRPRPRCSGRRDRAAGDGAAPGGPAARQEKAAPPAPAVSRDGARLGLRADTTTWPQRTNGEVRGR